RMVNDGHITGNIPFPVIVPAGVAEDNFALEVLSYVELRAGIYRWGVTSDDGFRVSPATSVSDANNAITLGVFDAGRGIGDTPFAFAVFEDGLYPIRFVYEEGGGDANVEWWSITDVAADPTVGPWVAINATDDPNALKAFQPQTTTPPPQITSATIATGQIT